MKNKTVWIILILLVVIQFIPYGIKNEERDPQTDFFTVEQADEATIDLIRAACYDCHSQEARKPWYAYVAPVKFWVNKHVRGARMHIDFSDWKSYEANDRRHIIEECVEMIKEEEMPLNSYTWMHPEAQLTEEQRIELIQFFKSKLDQY